VIDFANVTFSYAPGAFRLQVAELSFAPGQRTALIGPSGIGKSTLLLLAGGVILPSSGSVRVNSMVTHTVPPHELGQLRLLRVGMVFQEFELLEYLSVLDNITIAARLCTQVSRQSLEARGTVLARRAGVYHLLSRKPGRLSQGERQRVAVCRALATDPTVLLCDEPTGNLDPASAEIVTSMLLEHASSKPAAMIMATHRREHLDGFDRTIEIRLDNDGVTRPRPHDELPAPNTRAAVKA
jgi:putative ABC transport system ATP-binding protein